jgi:colicin import membrane protein
MRRLNRVAMIPVALMIGGCFDTGDDSRTPSPEAAKCDVACSIQRASAQLRAQVADAQRALQAATNPQAQLAAQQRATALAEQDAATAPDQQAAAEAAGTAALIAFWQGRTAAKQQMMAYEREADASRAADQAVADARHIEEHRQEERLRERRQQLAQEDATRMRRAAEQARRDEAYYNDQASTERRRAAERGAILAGSYN